MTESRDGVPRHRQRRWKGPEGNARLTGSTAAGVIFCPSRGRRIDDPEYSFTPDPARVHRDVARAAGLAEDGKHVLAVWSLTPRCPGDHSEGKDQPLHHLRLLGQIGSSLTVSVFATGIVLLLGPSSIRSQMLFLHKATFIVWIGAMALHVLGHVLDTARLAPRDWLPRTRRQVDGASLRQWSVAGSVALGLVLGVLVIPRIGPWLAAGPIHH